MPVDLIQVPYDSALRDRRMGSGPLAFVGAGAAARIREGGHDVREAVVEAREDFRAEVVTAFELNRSLALAVRVATGRGSFPLVLAGNCMTAVGTLAGLGTEGVGVVWLDAHADLNTPETTTSGFLDGMALATVTGRCWKALAGSVADFTPVPDERVLLLGARELDAPEEALLHASRIARVDAGLVRERGVAHALAEGVGHLRERGVERVYLHLDLDVHDAAEGRANPFTAPGGLSAADVPAVLRTVAAELPLAAAAITAYDPAGDTDGRILALGLDLIALLADAGARDGGS